MTKTRIAVAAFAVVLTAKGASAQQPQQNLVEATLEELLVTPVVTASRVPEQLNDAPARMVVITDADIRRRGYRSLTDVLEDHRIDGACDAGRPRGVS